MNRLFIRTYPWKWVCVQHPMILIGDDWSTPRALETVPPWGANDVPGYCHKMYEMLKKLEDTPEMKVDFDLSAKELLMFLECEPDGKALLKKLIASGQVGFTGTDYAQAHYATTWSESALRGVRMGAQVYEKELGVVSDTLQHQEIGIFRNMPQVVKAFGVTKSATFRFPTAMEFIDGSPELLYSFGELGFMNKNSMALWEGLDGTQIPMYLPWVPCGNETDFEAFQVIHDNMKKEFQVGYQPFNKNKMKYPTYSEENKGLCHGGGIIMQCPDMVEIDDDYIASRKNVGDFWRLSEALDEEIKATDEMPRMRYTSYWSYSEGLFGDRMYKSYRKSEAAILAAEAMQALAGGKIAPFDSWSAWDRLLAAQHHDVNWHSQTELRDRAESWALQARDDALAYQKKACDAIVKACPGEKAPSAVVFNTLPMERKDLVRLPADWAYRVYEGEKELPSQMDEGSLVFEAQLKGAGYKSYRLEKKEAAEEKAIPCAGSYLFENDLMKVEILPDGRIASLYSKVSGEKLNGCGNVMRALLWKKDNSVEEITSENAPAAMQVVEGALYNKVIIEGRMADIPYRMVIRLPHGAKSDIDFALDLHFDHHTLGDIVHDETKLNLYWPLKQHKPQLWIDEPFGVCTAKRSRPLLAASFITALEEGKGVTFSHTGTPKVWVEGNTLVNQLAWGGDTITNRMDCDWFGWSGVDIYDRTLNGNVHYDYTMSLTECGDMADVARAASRRITPMPVFLCDSGVEETAFVTVNNPNWITTAIEEMDGQTVVRGYECAGRPAALQVEGHWTLAGRSDVAGHPVEGEVRPYEITQLHFQK